jgi:aliphatic nitrilase
MTAIIGPDGMHVVPPLLKGEGILIADLDLTRIVDRKRMMDAVGHYNRPDLLSLDVHSRPMPAMRGTWVGPESGPPVTADVDEDALPVTATPEA